MKPSLNKTFLLLVSLSLAVFIIYGWINKPQTTDEKISRVELNSSLASLGVIVIVFVLISKSDF